MWQKRGWPVLWGYGHRNVPAAWLVCMYLVLKNSSCSMVDPPILLCPDRPRVRPRVHRVAQGRSSTGPRVEQACGPGGARFIGGCAAFTPTQWEGGTASVLHALGPRHPEAARHPAYPHPAFRWTGLHVPCSNGGAHAMRFEGRVLARPLGPMRCRWPRTPVANGWLNRRELSEALDMVDYICPNDYLSGANRQPDGLPRQTARSTVSIRSRPGRAAVPSAADVKSWPPKVTQWRHPTPNR